MDQHVCILIVLCALSQCRGFLLEPDAKNPSAENPAVCERGMSKDGTVSYPHYIKITHDTIGREIVCETETDGGGWIVIQRRSKGDVNFYVNWDAYRDGFGSSDGDFYLGNEAIHKLTSENPYELRIDFIVDHQEVFARYSSFMIEDEANLYTLRLGTWSGSDDSVSTSQVMSLNNNQAFTTIDRDNDLSDIVNCAWPNHAGWWFFRCGYTNLNGLWGLEWASTSEGAYFFTGRYYVYPTFIEMKIRRL